MATQEIIKLREERDRLQRQRDELTAALVRLLAPTDFAIQTNPNHPLFTKWLNALINARYVIAEVKP